jgi:hypothetical protein
MGVVGLMSPGAGPEVGTTEDHLLRALFPVLVRAVREGM